MNGTKNFYCAFARKHLTSASAKKPAYSRLRYRGLLFFLPVISLFAGKREKIFLLLCLQAISSREAVKGSYLR
jgi:hypothetical protein